MTREELVAHRLMGIEDWINKVMLSVMWEPLDDTTIQQIRDRSKADEVRWDGDDGFTHIRLRFGTKWYAVQVSS